MSANAFDRGLVPGTGLMRSAPAPTRFAVDHVVPHVIPLLRRVLTPNVHTIAESGSAMARLLTDPALQGTTGAHFEGEQEIRSSEEPCGRDRSEQL